MALVVATGVVVAPAIARGSRPALPLGRVIAQASGGIWIVPSHGAVSTIADAEAADWSPRLRILAVARRHGIAALDTHGRTRWALSFAQLAGAPRWSLGRPARLSFLVGGSLRIVDRDGGGVQRLGSVSAVTPVWRPGRDELAFVRPGGEIVLARGDGSLIARWLPSRMPVGLSWSGDGGHLVVSLRYSLIVLDAQLRPRWSRRTPAILNVAAAPIGTRFVVMTVRGGQAGPSPETLEVRDAARPGWRSPLTTSPGFSSRCAWSPDGVYVIVGRPSQRDWLLITVRTRVARSLALPPEIASRSGMPMPIAWAA